MLQHDSTVIRAHAVFTPALHLYYPITVVEGSGSWVTSAEGRRYLDFSSGLAVLNIGYGHPHVLAAARNQLEHLVHSGGIYFNETTVAAAERLVGITPSGLDTVFFSNSGAEAVEGALKLARFVTGRQGIISFTGAFHGRTLGAVSVTTSSARYRHRYHPLLPSVFQAPYPTCYRCPFGASQGECRRACLDYLRSMLGHVIAPEEVAAVIIEPVLGEGGYVPAPAEFLEELRNLCSTHGMLLIFDEVQSGMGRTGSWFAAHHYDVTPDVLAVAKGIASGFPLSAIVSRRDVMQKWPSGAHGTTFGGNPVSCAAAIATIEVMGETGLLERVKSVGQLTVERLRRMADKFPVLGDVRGFGYMIGMEFVAPGGAPDALSCQRLLDHCLSEGLILINCGPERNIIRFIPPLTASDEEIDAALTIVENGLEKL